MSRGQPDYNNPDYQIAITQGDVSLFFLAQNGYALIDARGRIVWHENFENGLYRWLLTTTGGASTPVHVLKANRAYGLNGAIELDPVAQNGNSIMSFEGVIPFGKRMGFEMVFNPVANHGKIEARFNVNYADDASYQMILTLYHDDNHVTISDGTTETTIYTPGAGIVVDSKWLNIKIIGDYSTGKYYRLVMGGHEFDITAYDMRSVTSNIKGRFYLDLRVIGQSGLFIEPLYIGAVTLTTDEP